MSGILNNISNLFRPTQQVSVAPQQPMAQVNPGAAAVVPPAGTALPTVQAPAEPANPLDNFASVWQTPQGNNGAPQGDPLATPLLNSDPSKIAAAAGKMDFLAKVPQEVMQRAMSGNDPQAFMQVMNFVGQQTLAAAAQLSTAATEHSHRANNQRLMGVLPGQIKAAQLASMTPENPVLQHEASQPLLKVVRTQIQQSEPNLSPQQIQAKAEQYLMTFASQLSPQAAAPAPAPGTDGSQDWDNWANS